jgi:hypothetical protein
MYEVFDFFMGIDTWHTRHDYDLQRFYEALDKVVWSDAFNADSMADYMRSKINVPNDDHVSHFAQQIERCRDDAWAVREFLKYSKTVAR